MIKGSPQKILEVKDLCVGILAREQKELLLDHIGFSLNKGESLGVVGESGSGKTLTALSVLKLLPPQLSITKGSVLFQVETGSHADIVTFNNTDIREIRGKRIAMIFQEPMTCLNPVITCGKQVSESLLLYEKISRRSARKITHDLFSEVHLPDPDNIYNKYPHQLSGGQRQRVMIAMALAGNPEILIADEPTTALDVTVQKSILSLLSELRSLRTMSILFISHDLGVIREVAERVLVMHQGRIVEQGIVENILQHPENQYTKGLIACRPTLETTSPRLKTISDFMDGEKSSKDIDNGENAAFLTFKPDYSSPPILSIDNVTTRYYKSKILFRTGNQYTEAVKRISFDIFQGETVGLIGESGSGKSTLGKTVIRLVESYSGNIYYRGKSLSSISKREMGLFRKNVQMVFQDPYSSLNPRMQIGEAISEVMKVHNIVKTRKERKEAVIELLKKVDLLPDHYNRFPHEFSGGQRQRIGIARALATQPELLICDESVSALDVSVQAQVLNLLNDLKEEYRLTYLFISHDLAVVKYMSDRIVVMKEGELMEQGDSDQIYRSPESDYTRSLIDANPE